MKQGASEHMRVKVACLTCSNELWASSMGEADFTQASDFGDRLNKIFFFKKSIQAAAAITPD